MANEAKDEVAGGGQDDQVPKEDERDEPRHPQGQEQSGRLQPAKLRPTKSMCGGLKANNGASGKDRIRAASSSPAPSSSSSSSSVYHFATCEEFVRLLGGKRVITKILIANNGIAGNSIERLTG